MDVTRRQFLSRAGGAAIVYRAVAPRPYLKAAGHYAAGAAHLANLAYKKGRRMHWDLETSKVSEG